MADERRKGPSDRRRTRATKAPHDAERAATQANGEEPARNPNDDAAAFGAAQLDESLRARQQEDRGEVF